MRESQKQTGVKYARFSAVGLSNMLVDFGALNLLLFLSSTRSPELLVAYNAAALILANANSYLWNTLWTFRHQAQHDAKQVSLFTAQGLLNIALGSALLWLAAHGLRAYTELPPWLSGNLAKAISMLSASTVSFLFLRFFVFRPRRAESGPSGRRQPDRIGAGPPRGELLRTPCLRTSQNPPSTTLGE